MDIKNDWRGKRVVVTGHTGFKGSWLTELLVTLGARVHGISLTPHGDPNLFNDTNLMQSLDSHHTVDIRDYKTLEHVMREVQPEFVFHFAAQSTVSRGYEDPRQTFEINTSGTVNVLMASLSSVCLLGIFCATTDKVYENLLNTAAKIESDSLGASDPYGASKVAAEFAIQSMRYLFEERGIKICIGRAGNVIGGGDWGSNRLVPDAIKSVIDGTVLHIRKPNSTRPWQYVLDCLFGYLLASSQILKKEQSKTIEIYNFGPKTSLTVREVVTILAERIDFQWQEKPDTAIGHEHALLSLNSQKAKLHLGWDCQFDGTAAIHETANWYRDFISGQNAQKLMEVSIDRFLGNVK